MTALKTIKKELPHFHVENNYGSNQNQVKDPIMRFAGCAAITACDCCLYFDREFGTNLFPNHGEIITQKEFQNDLKCMKRYLHPGFKGVTKLSLFTEGISKFMMDRGSDEISAMGLEGHFSEQEAQDCIVRQIDADLPVPYLMLDHKSFYKDDYVWHWFLLNGYDWSGRVFRVKAVSYGTWRWFTLKELWNTGCAKKGGLILFARNVLEH